MVKALLSQPLRRRPSKLEAELDEILALRNKHASIINTAAGRKAGRIQRATNRYNEEVGSSESELEKADERLARFMERHHYPLTRRLSKTIRRADGTVFEVLRKKELDLPANEEALLAHLLRTDEGRQFVKVKYTIDRTALSAAFAKGDVSVLLKRAVIALGGWFGKHRTFLVQSTSDGKQKTISRRRFNERKAAS